jgi:deoxyribose-phosphate aldolase
MGQRRGNVIILSRGAAGRLMLRYSSLETSEIARYFDHTVLKPEAQRADVLRVCREAREHAFAAVCVNPYWVPLVAGELAGSGVATCTVAGFPLGATSTAVKVLEAERAIRCGATEIDMVLHVGALKDGDHGAVRQDIASVAQACHAGGAILKVILETALLTDEEKRVACELSKQARADFVKTSTGFAKSGATAADIALMRAVVGPQMGVKASGGIRTYADFLAMVNAGASRIGASASVAILAEARR